MARFLPRRRVIQVSAAAAGLQVLPLASRAEPAGIAETWRGVVLGAASCLTLHHHDRAAARELLALSVAESRRLERIFTLYRDDSVLCGLNRRGVLEAPPAELVELLDACRRFGAATAGAFDPTVQPLWSLYLAHFSSAQADPEGPSRQAVDDALQRIGLANVQISRDRIAFMRRGMALTLNGIAQGYVTDRIVALLRAHGIGHSLVDLGEVRAIDDRPDGHPWEVAIADPEEPSRTADRLAIVDQAVATSAGYGFRFDAAGRFTHLFDPRTGRSPHRYRSVTVVAPTATTADALSTAFCLMPADAVERVVRQFPGSQARVVTERGEHVTIGA